MSTEIQKVKNQVALETWAAEVESCQSSGLTVTEWCKLNGINILPFMKSPGATADRKQYCSLGKKCFR